MQARDLLSKLGDLSQTQIFAKIENVEVSCISYLLIILTEFFRQVKFDINSCAEWIAIYAFMFLFLGVNPF